MIPTHLPGHAGLRLGGGESGDVEGSGPGRERLSVTVMGLGGAERGIPSHLIILPPS